jgi:hypothetical protein
MKNERHLDKLLRKIIAASILLTKICEQKSVLSLQQVVESAEPRKWRFPIFVVGKPKKNSADRHMQMFVSSFKWTKKWQNIYEHSTVSGLKFHRYIIPMTNNEGRDWTVAEEEARLTATPCQFAELLAWPRGLTQRSAAHRLVTVVQKRNCVTPTNVVQLAHVWCLQYFTTLF